MRPGSKFATIEGRGQEVVGAETETLDLVVELGKIRDHQDRRLRARRVQPSQHFETLDSTTRQIEENQVVIVQLADLQARPRRDRSYRKLGSLPPEPP
jgi:hypothetical protein